MGSRLALQDILEMLLGSGNVYYQPPSKLTLSYPCVVYDRSRIQINHADNYPYSHKKGYTVTVMDADPDSSIPDEVAKLSTASFDRQFTYDNLYHNVFTIYY